MGLEDYIDPGLKIEVTVWKDGDDADEGITFPSYVKELDLMLNRVLIHPPPPTLKGAFDRLQPGVLVGMVLLGNKGQVVLYPSVQKFQKEGLVGYWLVVPRDFEAEIMQRRRHVRIPMTLRLEIEAWTMTNHKLTVAALTQNLSGGGVRFVTAHHFRADDEIVLHLPLTEGALTVQGKVIFCRENAARFRKAHEKYVAAAYFLNLTEPQEAAIMAECFRKELEMRKKGL